MTRLVGFIDKERQAEAICEKMCARFAEACLADTPKPARDIAFCISQLNLSERAFKKFTESWKQYDAALYDHEVHACFIAMCHKQKRAAKPEANSLWRLSRLGLTTRTSNERQHTTCRRELRVKKRLLLQKLRKRKKNLARKNLKQWTTTRKFHRKSSEQTARLRMSKKTSRPIYRRLRRHRQVRRDDRAVRPHRHLCRWLQ